MAFFTSQLLKELHCWKLSQQFVQQWLKHYVEPLDVVSMLFRQHWSSIGDTYFASIFIFTKISTSNNVDERWRSTFFHRWFNVEVCSGWIHIKWVKYWSISKLDIATEFYQQNYIYHRVAEITDETTFLNVWIPIW